MINKIANSLSDELINIRRELHKIPELEFMEYKTVEFIKKYLDELKIPFETPMETAVVGLIKGREDNDKTILIRADIDALPITEQNDVDFKSQHKGIMHACGHDAHITCLLGACKILSEVKNDFCGNVKVVFQPAEEGRGGALQLVEKGVMNSPFVTSAIALHVEPLCSVGTLQYRNGTIMASPDDFKIFIKGKGGHGATPEDCNNPIYPATRLVNKIKTIVEDNFYNKSDAVVSVCTINAGTSNNIIPDSVEITGTARSLNNETRDILESLLKSYTKEISQEFNCEYEFIFNRLYPPVINDKIINNIVISAAKEIDGFTTILEQEKSSMTGDDFSYFAELVPSSYFKLGAGNETINNPLHSPKFNIDERCLSLGSAILAKTAINYLNGQQ